MSTNDNKIKDLLKTIEAKKAEIGEKPRAAYKTNGLIGEKKTNLNTVSLIETCVDLAADLIAKQSNRQKAAEALGVTNTFKEDTDISDALSDLKLRVTMLQWDVEKKKLNDLEGKLKDLRSEDLKTADALDEISNLLG